MHDEIWQGESLSSPSSWADLTQRLALLQIFRGNKVQNAEVAGCGAAILFSDPAEVAAEGTSENDVYPATFWLPGSGMQRGSIYMDDGDPETPRWPSLPGAFRVPPEDLNMPTIPAQPIGYDDAKKIFDL